MQPYIAMLTYNWTIWQKYFVNNR